jgi:phenylalanyl-tRNA synthetase alpha chain
MELIAEQASQQIKEAKTLAALEELRVHYLGKSGILTKAMAQIKDVPNEEKKAFGQRANLARTIIEDLLRVKLDELENQAFEQKLVADKVDLSIPGRSVAKGFVHPISQALKELIEIFTKLGFNMEQGPSIESDWYNFTALNIPENHPARQMHDTFYLNSPGKLLRTHTSPVQIRAMQSGKPPFKFISFGRTYRSDSDMTHTPMFHQMEALLVDKDINMGHLKWTLSEVVKQFFENDKIEVRMRPSFFPFTEPSAEVDIRMPGSQKWLEVLGSGMIHPKVLQNVGIDSKVYSGFALGLGVERFAMLKYGIKDLRQFFDMDINWMRHFGFFAGASLNLNNGAKL